MPLNETSNATHKSRRKKAKKFPLDRSTFLGASDFAGAMDESPFCTSWDVYAEKLHLIETPPRTPEMSWGTRLESGIVQGFSEEMRMGILWTNRSFRHRKYSFLRATPDALLDASPPCLLEVKKVRWNQAGEFGPSGSGMEGVPLHYLIQVIVQMAVLRIDRCYLAALIGDDDFRVYLIERDPAMEEIVIEDGVRFWREHVVPQVPPPIGPSKQAHEYLKKRFPRNHTAIRQATIEEIEWLEKYARIRRRQKVDERDRRTLEHQLEEAIAEADGIEWPHGRFTWKRIKDGSETSWDELSKKLMVGFAEDEIQSFIAEFTHPRLGYRKIDFRTDLDDEDQE